MVILIILAKQQAYHTAVCTTSYEFNILKLRHGKACYHMKAKFQRQIKRSYHRIYFLSAKFISDLQVASAKTLRWPLADCRKPTSFIIQGFIMDDNYFRHQYWF